MPAPVEPRPRGTDALGRPLKAPRRALPTAATDPATGPDAAAGPAAALAAREAAADASDAPAGFWRRAAAWSLDWLMLSPLLWLLVRAPLAAAYAAFAGLLGSLQEWMLEHALLAPQASVFGLAHEVLRDAALPQQLGAASATLQWELLVAGLRAAALAALWFVGFEASPWAATPGKRLLGLRVADLRGNRVSPARALARFAAGSLSWLTLNLGHALAGWRRDHRALHDLVAGTQVRGRGPTPRWARALVSAIVLLALFAPFLLAAQVLGALVP